MSNLGDIDGTIWERGLVDELPPRPNLPQEVFNKLAADALEQSSQALIEMGVAMAKLADLTRNFHG